MLFGSFAEFEREMIRERTRAGLDGLSALSGHRYPAWQQISRNPFVAYIALDDVCHVTAPRTAGDWLAIMH
jgi:hypothetical protein